MRQLITFLFIAASSPGFSQADIMQTSKGEVSMTPILHATAVLEWNGKTIYMDPYDNAERFTAFADPDLVCITHAHGDHFNMETLKGLSLENTILIAPQSVVDDLDGLKFSEVISLANSTDIDRLGLNVKAMPMYNLPDETARHAKGWGNGYILTIGDKTFYFSGDTEDIPEMRNLEGIDYAFVCMNLPYTMSVGQAADAVLEFKPAVVYPFHYRNKDGFSDVEKFRSIINAGDEGIEVRLRNWYPE